MGLALEEPRENDRRIEGDGARLWVQPEVDKYFAGAELDYDENVGGFKFLGSGYKAC